RLRAGTCCQCFHQMEMHRIQLIGTLLAPALQARV
ncbi:hypothetical protein XGA_1149, partial [Xanthomonas hortorum ATCC 19865]